MGVPCTAASRRCNLSCSEQRRRSTGHTRLSLRVVASILVQLCSAEHLQRFECDLLKIGSGSGRKRRAVGHGCWRKVENWKPLRLGAQVSLKRQTAFGKSGHPSFASGSNLPDYTAVDQLWESYSRREQAARSSALQRPEFLHTVSLCFKFEQHLRQDSKQALMRQ